MHPSLVCAVGSSERLHTRFQQRSHRKHPAFPARWPTASPRSRSPAACLPPPARLACTGSRHPYQGARIARPRRPPQAPSSKAPSASTATRPASVTFAKRPFRVGRVGEGYKVICDFGKAEYFCGRGWTGGKWGEVICPSATGCGTADLAGTIKHNYRAQAVVDFTELWHRLRLFSYLRGAPTMPTSDECVDALLGRGYFPKELPPPFQTSSFAVKAAAIRASWAMLRSAMTSKIRSKHPFPTHPVLFDMARKGHARRTLAIPNAINQFYLVEDIAKHWETIAALIESSTLSITKCSIATEGRAVPIPPLSSLGEKRIVLYAAQGAILQTDVLSFYHSIYTHAIPWAIHGKLIAKANRNATDPAVFGNRMDELVRSCQDGQTVGIPVGPDTSRIISEILLCAVEQKIPQELRRRIASGFRYIDDFFLCFDSLADAEIVLAGIREACLYFDLQLNAAKTTTISALAFNEETWPSEISAMRIAPEGKNQRRSMMRFFSGVIKLAKEQPSESIASFAVRSTTKILVDRENWDLYEAFLLRMARENSNCIDSVVKIICTYAAIGYVISNSVPRFIERIIADHAPYNQHFEVAWVLWLARSLSVRLSAASSYLVVRMENDICAILALHLHSRRLISGASKISSWLGSVVTADLQGDHWLLIYEASLRKGWPITGATAAVAGDNFFATMKKEGVSFYDSRAYNRPLSLPGIDRQLRSALGGRKRALLPGAILAMSEDEGDYEELGGDYGNDDNSFYRFFSNADDDEDIPI